MGKDLVELVVLEGVYQDREEINSLLNVHDIRSVEEGLLRGCGG